MRVSEMRPLRTASRTELYASPGSTGISSWSTPASIARSGISASPYLSRTPFIPSESVITTPSNRSCCRRIPVRIGRLNVAGSPDGSSAGTTMCAVMIDLMPARIAAWNGGRSIRVHSSRVWWISGIPTWLSVSVSPCPGKCFAVETIRPSRW